MSMAHRTLVRPKTGSMSAKGKTPRNLRNNNPGNLRDTRWVRKLHGYVGSDDEGFAIFKQWHYGLHGWSVFCAGPCTGI